ncbi:anti-anti-sigma factor [Micromonospora eburnea]|uniref:Anti-anti-sigma factor n=1 Tax=Micromonospora eburnea TaxID=227316 RepID=A0A1C6UGJ3_9ACTN|nr:STAS domain-containing protein [Micromonospora eburnea]SCL53157.1 anti-anti-sigma factor [Micromonospora eburnea]
MTVVPADHLMSLICDDCGDTITGTACVLPDAEVVWTLVFEHGWTGSPFASGPHFCPRCTAQPADGGDEGPDSARTPEFDDVLGVGDLDGVGDDRAAGSAEPAEPVRRALAEAVTLGRQVLVDLAEVRTIESVGLGLLVRAHQDARQDGKVLCLVAPSRFVRTVLHTMRLDSVFPVIPTRAAAFRRASRPPMGSTRPAPTAGAARPGRPRGEHPPVQPSSAAPAPPVTTTEVAR